MRLPKDYKEVGWPQLCAISRSVLETNPAMEDSEWRELTKQRLAVLEFASPEPETLSRAMNAVNYAHEKKHGKRPIPLLEPVTANHSAPQEDPPWSGSRNDASPMTSLAAILQNLKASRDSVKSSPSPAGRTADVMAVPSAFQDEMRLLIERRRQAERLVDKLAIDEDMARLICSVSGRKVSA